MSASNFAVSHASTNGYCWIISANPTPASSSRPSMRCGVTRSHPLGRLESADAAPGPQREQHRAQHGEQHVGAKQRHVTFEHNCGLEVP